MSETARGSFEVALKPRPPADGAFGRFDLEKTWSGDLAGDSRGEMLSAGDPATGRAGYVALEVFRGTVHGRSGSFALQQLGLMSDGAQQLRYVVVPGSGDGELVGIVGDLELTVDDRGHHYALTYSLDH